MISLNILLLPVLGRVGGSLTFALLPRPPGRGPLPRRQATLPSAHARVMGPGVAFPFRKARTI